MGGEFDFRELSGLFVEPGPMLRTSQFAISRSEVDFFTPTPITVFAFSRSLDTSGEKSESPLTITKVST